MSHPAKANVRNEDDNVLGIAASTCLSLTSCTSTHEHALDTIPHGFMFLWLLVNNAKGLKTRICDLKLITDILVVECCPTWKALSRSRRIMT